MQRLQHSHSAGKHAELIPSHRLRPYPVTLRSSTKPTTLFNFSVGSQTGDNDERRELDSVVDDLLAERPPIGDNDAADRRTTMYATLLPSNLQLVKTRPPTTTTTRLQSTTTTTPHGGEMDSMSSGIQRLTIMHD